jgi:NTE family protein
MADLDRGYCLVLAGGGAKGVYHLGVWKALRELGIEVDAFVGTSIGAVVAGLLAQDDDAAIEGLSESITVESVVALPEGFVDDGKLSVGLSSLADTQNLIRSMVKHGGLDTSPLRKLLESRIDESRVRASGKDLGVVTIDLTSFKPREMYIEEMGAGRLIDYLMASAAFPGFTPPVIEGKRYMDGGMADNIPYSMARQRGYRRIIVSDISGMGINRRPEVEGSLTVYIKNSIEMGGVLDFDREFMKQFELLGYLDAMRTFGRYMGYRYFVEPDPDSERAFLNRSGLPAIAGKVDPAAAPAFPKAMRYDRDQFLKYLECAAAILEVPRVRAYRYVDLEAAIAAKKVEDEIAIADALRGAQETRAAIAATLRESIARREFVGSPYYHLRLLDELLPKTAGRVLRRAMLGLFPELSAGMAYLASL